MDNELNLHIKQLQNRATFSLIAILLALCSVVFSILFLLVSSFIAIIFFVIALISIVYLLYLSRTIKKELKDTTYAPVIFQADSNFSFEEIVTVFEKLTPEASKLSTSENVLFFRLNSIFKLRTILYRTDNFDKEEFNKAKDRINKEANKKYNISPWVDRFDAKNMMRFNIIYTDNFNDALFRLISRNANRNLTRVEGIINIAIIGNNIIVPPIYGDCDLVEISRYKNTIKFINQFLLNR